MAGVKTSQSASKVELALNDQLFGGKGKGFAALKRPLLNLDNAVQRQAAWIDEDDEDVTVDLENTSRLRKLRKTGEETHVQGDVFQQRLKKQFESGRSAASWADIDAIDAKKRAGRRADLSDGESDDEEFDLFATSGALMERSHDVLLPGTLEVGRVKDANQHGQSNAVVQSVQFHPNGQLLLTAGLDKALRLFQIDGSTNSKIESIFLKDMPISCAKFTADGKRIIMSGPRTYIHSYDMEAGTVQRIPRVGSRKERKWDSFAVSRSHAAFLGKDGIVALLSATSFEWMGNLKMNGDVRSASFCDDDNYLLTTGSDGDVYKWDLRTRRCVYRVNDEGSLGSGAIAAKGKYVAVGADSGVVNVYNHETLTGETTPKPLKAFLNLTTSIDQLVFNPDAQILAMASKETKDALKLVR
ncbi:hypothetical protein, variant 1 [Aphanomyces astaci]|uniref:Anaphase-promoting complex subunit 4 WD40 domain-containing protein n=1 Tax=Aphanomyces astaci TaxID=112090 RepID=W4G0G0_APHAT|nr:hypothetical protein, variant 1 [Aphanomyces astaci]ETV72428.1 hypothetical protein, variant 1 [Aphanomyces astaci]|eukprot:XP_009838110.1 hypothetical protein, variant 1 [Aphanomyces astaci]